MKYRNEMNELAEMNEANKIHQAKWMTWTQSLEISGNELEWIGMIWDALTWTEKK